MERADVLVIGSSAAGLVAALAGKRVYSDKKIVVVRKEQKTLVPCGIPYIFGSIEGSDQDILPSDKMFQDAGIELKIQEAIEINRSEKFCLFKDGEVIKYDKLIIATGSTPKIPEWLNGKGLKNVFTVPKDKNYLDDMSQKLKKCKRIAVIGGGFIGVELSDELNKAGHEVTLIEILPHILGLAFDYDIAERVESVLKERGIKLKTGSGVKELLGDKQVDGVLLDNEETVNADAVILAMGYHPNSQLAQNAGLAISQDGYIKVDEYLRTEDPDIFAIGDCAEKRDFFTRKPSRTMLAATACAEARIAGMNLFKLSAVKTFIGTISIFSTAIGEWGFGVAGLTETTAKSEGFEYVTGTFEGMDKHPGTLPNAKKQTVKLVVGRESGIILGGELTGGLSIGELTNTLGFIIQNRMDLNSILTAQIGTHPLLTASPAAYPLLKAAGNAAMKIMFRN